MSVSVHPGTVEEAASVYAKIPEFDDRVADVDEMSRRLARDNALVLIAEIDANPVGFKAGYDRYQDGSWYSWLGAVTPDARGQGVGVALLEAQEAWLRERGYERVYVKTRNKFVSMRVLLAKNGYEVVAVDSAAAGNDIGEARITHVKKL